LGVDSELDLFVFSEGLLIMNFSHNNGRRKVGTLGF
jgi:hypothetical protein